MSTPPNTVNCKQFTDQLDEWIGGERSAAARVHARECPACRGMAEDFVAIGRAAREWSLEDAEPSPRLWNTLRAQLQEEGLIRDSSRDSAAAVAAQRQLQTLGPKPAGWFAGLFSGALRPAVAGAYLALLIAVSVLFVGPSGKQMDDSQWLARTQTSTTPLNAELNSAEHAVLSDLATANPIVSASFHQNLAIIDRDIVLCEKSVREEPGNELARDYLYEAYEQKADLLDQMADRGVGQ